MKPIAEWTDDELRDLIARPGRATWPQDFPAEVLRLRAMQVRHNSEMEAYCRYQREATARAEKAEADRETWCARAERAAETRNLLYAENIKLGEALEKAEAALARVRALCDEAEGRTTAYSFIVHTAQIRAAIEGEH